ncbi:MAG TPA: DUF2059 domain-containing protein [Sphingobium sp.]|jgi:hypothetical protein|uniref:DUF2059 domain-containing protein n=1 Tax=unclassified Sphingobium TaxID=2611147 RepID=UPI0007F33CB9|nr:MULTISPECIES: DUF2059 domain-containing protein [unclassified Sphingobium]OAN52048.1 hypothetical protein A7Q26_10270 [Sphingobium sp. TCM1]WIW90031.1 DUF2059 domain-containing protein [Sphingobium sp. V4]HAF43178.1 DUF2059 domain-containing protein [Sphingobium sp.]
MRLAFLSLPLLLLSAPLAAQVQPAPAQGADVQSVDPELLAKAQPIASVILPDGTMERMMGPMMQKMMAPMMDGMTKMPIREFLKVGGMDPDKADSLGEGTMEEMMAIIDPSFRKRMDVIVNTMMPAMGRFMGRYEPEMREGMAEAFAYRYNAAELDQIAAFLKTPIGAKFGAGFMQLATDPHYLGRMQKIMPDMLRAMPEIMKSSEAELAKLQKPRSYKDLTKAERDRLTALLGADAGKAN